AIKHMQRKLSPYAKEDVRYVPTIEEDIARVKAVTRDQVVKLYAEQLGAQDGALAVIGDFDPESTIKQVQELLDDCKARVPYKRIGRPAHPDLKGERKEILTPDKANAIFLAAHGFALRDDDPDYPALRVASYLFGEGSLSSRLANQVRGKKGLSYGVGS